MKVVTLRPSLSDGNQHGVWSLCRARTYDKGQVEKDGKKTIEIRKEVIRGKIDPKDITTALVERNNLTIRTFLRRTARLTIAFSKRLENLEAATAIHVTAHNYCWRLRTIKTTPAVQAGIASHRFSFAELYYLLRDSWPHLFLLGERAA